MNRVGKMRLGNESEFFELVQPNWMADSWRERFAAHKIKSVLDLGMFLPLAGFTLWCAHGLEHFEGYDRVAAREALSYAPMKNPSLKGASEFELLTSLCFRPDEEAEQFLGRAVLRWNYDLLIEKDYPRCSSYDLVVLSNLLHFLERPFRKVMFERLEIVWLSKPLVYIHVKEKANVALREGVRFDLLLEDCRGIAERLDLKEYGPFTPLVGQLDPSSDTEGRHYTWTNL